MIAFAVFACEDDQPFNPTEFGVEIEAGVQESFATGEDVVLLAVENRGSDTVYYYGARPERREDKRLGAIRSARIHHGPTTPIEPYDAVSVERDIRRNSFDPPSSVPPGEYRFIVGLSAAGGMTSDAVASNTFRIKSSDP